MAVVVYARPFGVITITTNMQQGTPHVHNTGQLLLVKPSPAKQRGARTPLFQMH